MVSLFLFELFFICNWTFFRSSLPKNRICPWQTWMFIFDVIILLKTPRNITLGILLLTLLHYIVLFCDESALNLIFFLCVHTGLLLKVGSAGICLGPRNLHLNFTVKYYSISQPCNLPFKIYCIDIFWYLFIYFFFLILVLFHNNKVSQFRNHLKSQKS